MNDWSTSQIREIVNDQIVAERRLRDALRKEDREALKLQAAETKRRLESYPTLRDFNDLKGRVDIIITLFRVLASLSVFLTLLVAVFAYLRP